MFVCVCVHRAQWAQDLACELLWISTPLSRGRRGQVNTENGDSGVCEEYTHNACMYGQTHTQTCARRGAKLVINTQRGALWVTAKGRRRAYLFICISGYMCVCLRAWQPVCSYVQSVCVPVRVNICVRACPRMCAQWCPAGGCSCRSCLCSQRVKG